MLQAKVELGGGGPARGKREEAEGRKALKWMKKKVGENESLKKKMDDEVEVEEKRREEKCQTVRLGGRSRRTKDEGTPVTLHPKTTKNSFRLTVTL